MLCECRHIQANLSCGSWTKAEQIQQPLGLDLGNWEASYWAQVVRLVQSFSQFLRGKLKTWQYHHEFFLSCFLLAVLEFWMLYRLYRLYDLIWGASWVHATAHTTWYATRWAWSWKAKSHQVAWAVCIWPLFRVFPPFSTFLIWKAHVHGNKQCQQLGWSFGEANWRCALNLAKESKRSCKRWKIWKELMRRS